MKEIEELLRANTPYTNTHNQRNDVKVSWMSVCIIVAYILFIKILFIYFCLFFFLFFVPRDYTWMY